MSPASPSPVAAGDSAQADSPPKSGLVLLALVVGAVVANINLGIANVALPTIGRDLGASQDQLTSVANAFALGLASTVLYLGALGDRYGRKLLFVCGAVMTIPTAFLAAYAPTVEVLILARFLGGIAAALLFPTTLSLISALYRSKAKVRAIALWSGIGGGCAALGPVLAGWLLQFAWWGSVFLVTLPLVVVALVIGWWVLPWHANEDRFAVDHVGGVLSVIGVGGLVLAIEHADTGLSPLVLWTLTVSVITLVIFFWRQTRASRPLINLAFARARTYWVAFVAGAITFGSLIGAMFIGQQFMQNVLGYSALNSALVVLPSAILTAVFGQVAGELIEKTGSRLSFALGLLSTGAAFLVMLLTWHPGTSLGWVIAAYALVGAGVGLAATPASRALMASVPTQWSGMGSAGLDLTRDFGGAILQAAMGGLLAAAYAARMRADLSALPPDQASQVSTSVADQLTGSFEGSASVAQSFPDYAQQILTAASTAFTDGKDAAIAVALAMSVIGFILVVTVFPGKKKEDAHYAKVQSLSDR